MYVMEKNPPNSSNPRRSSMKYSTHDKVIFASKMYYSSVFVTPTIRSNEYLSFISNLEIWDIKNVLKYD